MNRRPGVYRQSGFTLSRLVSVSMAVTLFLGAGCSSIWNAGDLALWVKDRAAEQGCQRETIELEEWYTETAEGNVWRGTRRDAQGKVESFGINVDAVWTPSKATT